MVIAVDVGATKTLVAQFDNRGKLGESTRFETPHNFDEFRNRLLDIMSSVSDEPDAIVIALPGVVAHDGILIRCTNLPWENQDMALIFRERFRCPVYTQNDANLGGLAEINMLSPLPRCGLYLTLSTGIGSGIIIDGRLLPGLSLSEVGNMLLEHEGNFKIWDWIASGKTLFEQFRKPISEIDDPVAWEKIVHRIALGLFVLIPALQPEVIVFGGSVGEQLEKYRQPLVEYLESHLTKEAAPTVVGIPKLLKAHYEGGGSVINGCYYYARQKLAD